jgi:hypothetical protein
MPGVFHTTEKDNAARVCDSVAIVFISLWKLKFLAYLLNVTKRFIMRIISYANVVYFIHMQLLQLAMDGRYRNCYAVGCTARRREGRGELFRLPRNPVGYVHKIIEQICYHLFICHTTHFLCQTEFMNFHILTVV